MVDISEMVGKTFVDVVKIAIYIDEGGDVLDFIAEDGSIYRFYHSQSCCECVCIEEIIGDLKDLIGSPLLEAEEVSSAGAPDPSGPPERDYESYTWTFYKFGTINGCVNVRWLGTSNGWYSESVSLDFIPA